MRRHFLVFCLLFVAAAVILATAGTAGPVTPKASSAGSCMQTASPQFVMPGEAPKPAPTSPVLCLVEICKLDHGTLYRCTANVGDCCRYQTNKDCVADPNCTASVPPFCPADPPNACNNTCQG